MSVNVHEAYCLDSQFQQLLWWDDFLGAQLKDEWTSTGDAGGSAVVVDSQTGGIVRITTDVDNTDDWRIEWNNIRSLLVTKYVSCEARVKLNQTTNCAVRLHLFFDGDNYMGFVYFGVGNWNIINRSAAAQTQNDAGIAPDTSYHIFRFNAHTHGGNHIHYYIDDVECDNSPISTNVPINYLQPYLFIYAGENVAKSMDVDYVVVRQDR